MSSSSGLWAAGYGILGSFVVVVVVRVILIRFIATFLFLEQFEADLLDVAATYVSSSSTSIFILLDICVACFNLHFILFIFARPISILLTALL